MAEPVRTPDQIKMWINKLNIIDDGRNLDGARGALIHMVEEYIDPLERKLVLCWLFRPGVVHQLSSSQLTRREILSLKAWAKWEKLGEEWLPSVEFPAELRGVAKAAEAQYNKDHNQTQLEIIPGGLVDTAIQLGGEVVEKNKPVVKRTYTFD